MLRKPTRSAVPVRLFLANWFHFYRRTYMYLQCRISTASLDICYHYNIIYIIIIFYNFIGIYYVISYTHIIIHVHEYVPFTAYIYIYSGDRCCILTIAKSVNGRPRNLGKTSFFFNHVVIFVGVYFFIMLYYWNL